MIDLLLRKMQPQDRVERLQGATQLLHRRPLVAFAGCRFRQPVDDPAEAMDVAVRADHGRQHPGAEQKNEWRRGRFEPVLTGFVSGCVTASLFPKAQTKIPDISPISSEARPPTRNTS